MKDIEGRSEEITEYLLGVEALGSSASFSPGEDSSVRSRAHALRKKLQEYYLVEAPMPISASIFRGALTARNTSAAKP